ncbi:hypothetical protein MYCTH_2299319, partial [Thermothelomyces thermophilus ATCC 42464]
MVDSRSAPLIVRRHRLKRLGPPAIVLMLLSTNRGVFLLEPADGALASVGWLFDILAFLFAIYPRGATAVVLGLIDHESFIAHTR